MRLIDKTTACSLHRSLVERASFSDWHEVPSYSAALDVLQEAGLGAILLPHRRSARSKEWQVSLGIVANEPGSHVRFNDDPKKDPTKIYFLAELRPMTDYVSPYLELTSCRLDEPWWAVPSFFSGLSNLLAPGYSDDLEIKGCRSDWGRQQRNAFDKRFRELWIDVDQEPEPLRPMFEVDRKLIRFQSCPVIPLAPAHAGDDT